MKLLSILIATSFLATTFPTSASACEGMGHKPVSDVKKKDKKHQHNRDAASTPKPQDKKQ